MAEIDGKHYGSSSVGRSLARHKMAMAQQSAEAPGGENPGDGHEITITRMPGGGYHTKATHHDGHVSEADHQSYEQAAAHGASHMGHQKPMREKNPKMREKEEPPENVPADHAQPAPSLSDMGIDAGE